MDLHACLGRIGCWATTEHPSEDDVCIQYACLHESWVLRERDRHWRGLDCLLWDWGLHLDKPTRCILRMVQLGLKLHRAE
jgi:hypothetical protein